LLLCAIGFDRASCVLSYNLPMIFKDPGPHNVPTFKRCSARIWTGAATEFD
jgi:hypothetical protein